MVKFGKRLVLEMHPEWRDYYVSYKKLKRLVDPATTHDSIEEHSDRFLTALRDEMRKVEMKLVDMIEDFEQQVSDLLRSTASDMRFRTPLTPAEMLSKPTFQGYPEDLRQTRQDNSNPIVRGVLSFVGDSRIKNRHVSAYGEYLEVYVMLRKLLRFCELNLEALRKATRKFDKNTGAHLGEQFSFEMEACKLTQLQPRIRAMLEAVKSDYNAKFDDNLEQFRNVTMASERWSINWRTALVIFALFLLLLGLPIIPASPEAHKAFALFVMVLLLWVTEAVPLFSTAMLIPMVIVPFQLLRDHHTGHPMSPQHATHVLLGTMFDRVQILMLSGYAMAKAISKCHLDLRVTHYLHSRTLHNPPMYLLSIMLVSFCLSAFVSNIASPLLMMSVVQPTLWELPHSSPAPRAILLALAFSCNLGGMVTPIASPQTAVVIDVLTRNGAAAPTFVSWLCTALPLALVLLLLTWKFILASLDPFADLPYLPTAAGYDSEATAGYGMKERMGTESLFVIVICSLTVALWLIPGYFPFLDMGIVALIPLFALFANGILRKEDFNSLPWHLVFMLGSGNMLLRCMQDAGLLELAVTASKSVLHGMSPVQSFIAIIVVMGVVTTFVSHTVAAIVLFPVVYGLASTVHPVFSPQALLIACAMADSATVMLPISSFPNINSLLAEDEFGQTYLQTTDFLCLGGTVTALMMGGMVSVQLFYMETFPFV